MMWTRRGALALLSAASASGLGSAALTAPPTTHVACARDSSGGFVVAGITATGGISWTTPLPSRAHGIAVHPNRQSIVVFARRPGHFALVLDAATGSFLHKIVAGPGRHFYGHGVYSADGKTLFTTENDYEGERGVIGRYDATKAFRRIGEWDSGGIGPHEVIRTADGASLAVAIGGIATHPDFPRQKLNLDTMRPGVCILDAQSGAHRDRIYLSEARHQLSLRHLAEAQDGSIWVGGQYEGAPDRAGRLLVRYQEASGLQEVGRDSSAFRNMRAYIGSVARSSDGRHIATTGPRGAEALVWHAGRRKVVQRFAGYDLSGVAAAGQGLLFTDGHGQVWLNERPNAQPLQWDNHVTAL